MEFIAEYFGAREAERQTGIKHISCCCNGSRKNRRRVYMEVEGIRARGTTGAPHPDAKALAEPLMHEFENRDLI